MLFQSPIQASDPIKYKDTKKNNKINVNDDAITHNKSGMVFMEKGYPLHAINEFKIAIMLNPNSTMSAAVYNNLGRAYETIREYDHAIASYEHAIKINPNFALYYKNLVNAYINKKTLTQALKNYEEIIKINPQDAQAFYILGLIYMKQGQNDEAIKAMEQFINLEPKLDLAHSAKKYIKKLQDSTP